MSAGCTRFALKLRNNLWKKEEEEEKTLKVSFRLLNLSSCYTLCTSKMFCKVSDLHLNVVFTQFHCVIRKESVLIFQRFNSILMKIFSKVL